MRYLLMLVLLLPTLAFAGVARDVADDTVMEARMIHLAEKVRCLVCQSEPVSTSHSEWSQDVRQIMREKMKAGASDQEILDMLVARFGKSVLFDPPVDKETAPLWSAPFILLLLGAVVFGYQLKKRKGTVVEAELSIQDEQRAARLLNEDDRVEPALTNNGQARSPTQTLPRAEGEKTNKAIRDSHANNGKEPQA